MSIKNNLIKILFIIIFVGYPILLFAQNPNNVIPNKVTDDVKINGVLKYYFGEYASKNLKSENAVYYFSVKWVFSDDLKITNYEESIAVPNEIKKNIRSITIAAFDSLKKVISLAAFKNKNVIIPIFIRVKIDSLPIPQTNVANLEHALSFKSLYTDNYPLWLKPIEAVILPQVNINISPLNSWRKITKYYKKKVS